MTRLSSENRAIGSKVTARKVVAVLGLIVLVAIAAEVTVRVEDWVRYRAPLGRSLRDQSDLSILDATGRHPMAGRRFQKWSINSVGTRGPEPDPSRVGSRVIVAGASETFGLYESPNAEYPRQLADTLARLGCSADVLNAGFPGMSLPTVDQDLRLRLSGLKPRVVVYYPTPQQYAEELPHAVIPDSSGRPTAPEPAWRLRFTSRAYNQLKAMLPFVSDFLRRRDIAAKRAGKPDSWLYRTIPEGHVNAFEADLRTLVGSIRSSGATPVLVTHANGFSGSLPMGGNTLRAWERFYPRATGEALVQLDSLTADRIRRVAADSGVALVDAWQAFHGVRAKDYFADFSHFTDRGAGRMAGLLAPVVAASLGCGAA
ncbi:MAG: hypothetical protein MNPFHGCM_02065 [Gemmatimonadaceae bacterium]|nr:hypothetical protein [Gemmatimonadaceae bacterium]